MSFRSAYLAVLFLCSACCYDVDGGYGTDDEHLRPVESALVALDYKFVNQLVDSSDNGYQFAYAPSIIYDDITKTFHMFYCSTGTPGLSWDWDRIRYVTSTDGRRWSAPQVILKTSDPINERSTCDPSVVRYQAPGDTSPYYYLFYSGNQQDVQGVMFVARSENIAGPYKKWTTTGMWVADAPNPKIIISPKVPKPDAPGGGPAPHWYGAGEQTVVVRGNKLVSWYLDDTACSQSCFQIYMSETSDPTSWPTAGTPTNVLGNEQAHSVDVKWDPVFSRYVMFEVANGHGQNSYLTRRHSLDGLNWDLPETLCDADCFPDYAHNVGVSGNQEGHLIRSGNPLEQLNYRALIVYGAPYDLYPGYTNAACTSSTVPYCFGHWDLYSSVINPRGQVWNDIPWGWHWYGWPGAHKVELALGDYDGDGKTDRAIVDRDTSSWFIIPSDGSAPTVWNENWLGMVPQHELVLGDYDGDRKTDRAIVERWTGKWFVIPSSGLSLIPWGWQWPNWGPPYDKYKFAVGDFDGDAITDRAIVDQLADTWWTVHSTQPLSPPSPYGWPISADHMLAVGDYNGDTIADRAMIEPSTGKWFIQPSDGSQPPPAWWNTPWIVMGPNHSLAVGDYDGDHKADRVIVDRATGRWYIDPSSGSSPFPSGWQWVGMTSQHVVAVGDYDGDQQADRAIVDFDNPDLTMRGRWFVIPSAPFTIY